MRRSERALSPHTLFTLETKCIQFGYRYRNTYGVATLCKDKTLYYSENL